MLYHRHSVMKAVAAVAAVQHNIAADKQANRMVSACSVQRCGNTELVDYS